MPATKIILLADDDPDDVHFVREAFKRAGYDNPFHVVRNGEQTIAYLKGEGKYANRNKHPIPALLLLDLKMPRIDGFEVIQWIRSRPEWRCLPIIVLTTSFFGPDIIRAYDLGANSFLTKPSDLLEYVGAVKQVAHFWLVHNSLPQAGPFIPSPPGYSPESRSLPDQQSVTRKPKTVSGRNRLQSNSDPARTRQAPTESSPL
jgi:two-component system response regulator